MNEQNDHDKLNRNQMRTLDHRLHAVGLGLFFIMIGVLWTLPEGTVHDDAWLIGMGIIIFALSGIRILYGLKIRMFRIVIGTLALTFGISGVYGLSLPVFQVILIIVGISIIMRPRKGYKYWDCCRMMEWRRNRKNRDIIN